MKLKHLVLAGASLLLLGGCAKIDDPEVVAKNQASLKNGGFVIGNLPDGSEVRMFSIDAGNDITHTLYYAAAPDGKVSITQNHNEGKQGVKTLALVQMPKTQATGVSLVSFGQTEIEINEGSTVSVRIETNDGRIKYTATMLGGKVTISSVAPDGRESSFSPILNKTMIDEWKTLIRVSQNHLLLEKDSIR